jgi:hypothetical protein
VQPTTDDIEFTMRTSQQVLDQGAALLEQVGRSNVDFAKLSADWQAEVRRMGEAVNSPKATAEIGEQYVAVIKELQADLATVDSLLAEAQALAPANESSAAKPSRHRGMRV